MKDKIEFAVELVKQTGEHIKHLMETQLQVETKSADNDFVTNADKGAERFLIDGITRQYENQDFITEEKLIATEGLDDLWIIDPIDGTTNFIYQKENFAVSVGFYHKKKPVFGIVYDVMKDELFLGIEGEGAYLNGKALPMLDQNTKLKTCLVNCDLNSLSMFKEDPAEFKENFVAHRYLGAASIELVGVAANRNQVYISKNLKVWDVAAGAIVLRAVGGYSSFGDVQDGIFFSDEDGEFFSCINEGVHKEFMNLKKAS